MLFGGAGGPEELRWAEHHGSARLDDHLLSSLGVAPSTLPLLADHERPEPGDLDLFPVAQLVLDRIEDDLDQPRGLPIGDPAVALVDYPGDVGLGHSIPEPTENLDFTGTYAENFEHYMSRRPRSQEENGDNRVNAAESAP